MIKHKGNIKQALESLQNIPNAFAKLFSDASFKRGTLEEATFSIKANFAMKDEVVSGSSKILENFKPSYDATVLKKFIASGAALVAQTHGDEFGLGGTGLDSAFGPIYNPLDNSRMIGGSSSGAVASLVDGLSIAIGSDTGDSVRTPASFVGKVGYKPSYGAVSRNGLYAFATSLDTVGFMTHNVNDAIVAAQVSFGFDQLDMTSRDIEKPVIENNKPQKVCYLKNLIDLYHEEYQQKFYKFIELLKSKDIEVVEENIDNKLLELISVVYQIISFSEASSNLANLDGINFGSRVDGEDYKEIMTHTRSEKFGKILQRRLTLGAYFLSREHQIDIFQRAQKVRTVIVEAFNKIYEKHYFIVSIATPIAPKLEEGKGNSPINNFSIHSNFEGSPSIVLPFDKKDNMPFALSLDAKQDEDKKLLSSALYLEKLIGEEYE